MNPMVETDKELQRKNKLSGPTEIFCRKIREGNILFGYNLNLAQELLNQQSPSRDQILMGEYCLTKAHEQKPFDVKVIQSLIHIKKILGKKTGLDELTQILYYLKLTGSENGDQKIGLNYLINNQPERAKKYLFETDKISNMEILFSLSDALVSKANINAATDIFTQNAHFYKKNNQIEAHFLKKHAELFLLSGNNNHAAECLKKSLNISICSATFLLLGECHYRMGNRSQAMEMWRKSLALDPLQIPLYLKLYDLAAENDKKTAYNFNSHKINILIYSYNKCEALKKTLDSLSNTDIGNARILILDNNCTDGTKEMLKGIPELFPGNKVKIITMPVNIGAPAARNWLMAQPENDDTDFIAFLDDDVLLPQDWLKKLISTLNHFPKAAIAGTKVTNESHPKTIQYIYRFLDVVKENKLVLSSKHPDEPDLGQFDFTRKCLSVMGCCHLLRTRVAREVGEFDIRFSPSQVDDIDHDFMTCMKGYEIIYNGHIDVVHCQKAGKEAFLSRPALGNVMGNDYKLAMKHPTEDMWRLKKQTEDIDQMDIEKKIHELRQSGCLEGVSEVPFNVV